MRRKHFEDTIWTAEAIDTAIVNHIALLTQIDDKLELYRLMDPKQHTPDHIAWVFLIDDRFDALDRLVELTRIRESFATAGANSSSNAKSN